MGYRAGRYSNANFNTFYGHDNSGQGSSGNYKWRIQLQELDANTLQYFTESDNTAMLLTDIVR